MPSDHGNNSACFSINIDSWRFLLIAAIVVNHGLLFSTAEAEMGAMDRAGVIITRAGVPALSLFSGFLFAGMREGTGRLLRKKIRSLILPFLAWNSAILLSLWGLNEWLQLDPSELIAGQSRYELVNDLTAFHGAPANAPLYFLRDLFVCCLILGPLRRALRNPDVFAFVLALAILNYATGMDGRIFIRDTIPVFMLVGFGLRGFPGLIAACGRRLAPLAILGGVLVLVWAGGEASWGDASVLDLLTLATFAGLVVGLADRLRPMPRLAAWGRRYAFVVFLSHWWVLLLLELAWDWLAWSQGSYRLLAGALAILAGVLLTHLIRHLPGPLGSLLTGGRTPKPAPAGARAA